MLPFDNIKTHSQIQKYEKLRYHQIAKIIYQSKKDANLFQRIGSFWKGGYLVSLGCGPAHAAFFSMHEINKSYIVQCEENIRPLLFAIGGGVACFFHDLVMTPFDAMKQRSQILHQKNNLQVFNSMLKNEGIGSFYRSFPVTLLMNVPFNGVLIMTNETIKPLIQDDQNHTFMTYFLCAGFSTCAATMPLDNIKTRLQTQGGQEIERTRYLPQFSIKYLNIVQTFKTIMKEEGLKGLFKGTSPKIASVVPSSAISWSIYEIIKRFIQNQQLF